MSPNFAQYLHMKHLIITHTVDITIKIAITIHIVSVQTIAIVFGGTGLPASMPIARVPLPTGPTSIYYGAYAGNNWMGNLDPALDFNRDAGKGVSIMMWYQEWGEEGVGRYFQPGWMENVRAHGSIPMISWDPWNGENGEDAQQYSLQNIIAGKFDGYIKEWAEASKAWGYPYFLRFAPEMNGNWYPWSELAAGNKAGQYVQAWRHVYDLFTQLGVHNVTWVWSPNVEYTGSTPLSELYPGNAYVDWLGMDGYNWGNTNGHHWQTFTQIFQPTYLDLLRMGTGKPIMISQMASASNDGGNDVAHWIASALTVELPFMFPEVKAFIWSNANHGAINGHIDSLPDLRDAFAHVISSNIYASNQYANLDTSPIPVPADTLHFLPIQIPLPARVSIPANLPGIVTPGSATTVTR